MWEQFIDDWKSTRNNSGWICESCIYYLPSSCDGKPCCLCDHYEIKSKLHDSMNTEIYITGENLVVDIIYHSYGTADIKLRLMFGRNLKEGADNE